MKIKNIFQKNKQITNIESRSYDNSSLFNYLTYNSYSSFTNSRTMNLSCAYRCVEVISDSVAQLPISLYSVDKEGYKTKIYQSNYNQLLNNLDNRMSKFTFLKQLVANMLLNGNGYAEIKRNEINKEVESLFLHNSNNISVLYNHKDNSIRYQLLDSGRIINQDDMIHILNFSYDGIIGISTIEHAKNTLQLSADSESHARGFFKGGANVAGILKVLGVLPADQREKIKQSWQSAFNASNGTPNGIAVLEGNMEFQPITVKPSDSQLLETRKFNVIDVCRFFGVSPIKAFDLTSANYSTVEATQLAFLTDTLSPLLEKIEEEFNRKLFNNNNLSINFDESALLRTDKNSQAEYYTKLINSGIMTPSEVRRELGLDKIDNSDKLLIQVNMTTLEHINNNNVNE